MMRRDPEVEALREHIEELEKALRNLRHAEYQARVQEQVGNEGDADAIRRSGIRDALGDGSRVRADLRAENERLREAIASAMTSLATGPGKDGYAYAVLEEASRNIRK